MTAPTMRELCEAVRNTWKSLCDGPDTGAEYLIRQQLFDDAERALERALGGCTTSDADEAARAIIAALDAERAAGRAEERQTWVTALADGS